MRVLKYRKTAKNRLTTDRHSANVERSRVHVAKGDTVRIVRGDDKGKEGTVIRVFPKKNRVVVKGVNIVKKHRRATSAEEEGGIREMEAPMAASNVMLIDPKSGKPTRVKARTDRDGTKERVSVKSGDSIPMATR
ncbi:MAG TPA: 50S ribosomal protein L24 [Gemmatimonadaceae bacterium]